MYLQGPAGSIHESWPHLVIWPLPTLKMWSLYKVAEKSTPAKNLLGRNGNAQRPARVLTVPADMMCAGSESLLQAE